jgi:hypothetical protein
MLGRLPGQPNPTVTPTKVSPVYGVMEVNLLLQVNKDSKCVGVVLVAKRLLSGGTMQPEDMVKRQAIHSVFKEGLMLVKAFMGPKSHGFVSIHPDDQAKIMEGVETLYCLEEVKKIDSDSLLKRVVQVGLSKPLDMRSMRSSRNLLDLKENPMESPLDFHRLAQSLYPNPTVRKSGSRNDKKWKAAVSDLLVSKRDGKLTPSLAKLACNELLLPVDSITKVNGDTTVFSIFKSKKKIFVEGLGDCVHDGGVVIYKISKKNGQISIKRQVRVLTDQRKRDVGIQPRSAPIRFSYISNTSPTSTNKPPLPKDWKYLTDAERYDRQCKILTNIESSQASDTSTLQVDTNVLNIRVAALSSLGTVDSTWNCFDKITGIRIFICVFYFISKVV